MTPVDRLVDTAARKSWLLIALIVASACTPAPTGQPAARSTGATTRVRIDHNGARSEAVSGDETVAICKRFQLSPADVNTFFAKAEAVDEHAFLHDLDMSRCYASGAIDFGDGRRGTWFIDLERRGSLTLGDGAVHYRYCLACTSPKFDTLDADTRDNARMLIDAAKPE